MHPSAGKAASVTAVAPERQLTLTNIVAPRFGRSKNAHDEPFAFESREWLRKKLLGKSVTFRVSHKHEASGREYGTVACEGEDVATAMVAAGWARARVPNAKGGGGDADDAAAAAPSAAASASGSDRDALIALDEAARTQQIGVHARGGAAHVRSINYAPDARALFEQVLVPRHAIHSLTHNSFLAPGSFCILRFPNRFAMQSM
jgi:endonuclease YncB( thermonuclease family)